MGLTSVELLIDVTPMRISYSGNVIAYGYTDSLSAMYEIKTITYDTLSQKHTQIHSQKFLLGMGAYLASLASLVHSGLHPPPVAPMHPFSGNFPSTQYWVDQPSRS